MHGAASVGTGPQVLSVILMRDLDRLKKKSGGGWLHPLSKRGSGSATVDCPSCAGLPGMLSLLRTPSPRPTGSERTQGLPALRLHGHPAF